MKLAATIALSVMLAFSSAQAQEVDRIDAATAAAERWLELLDNGKTAETWTAGAAALRAAVPQEQWVAALRSVRQPLGAVKWRKLEAATHTRSLPGAPDGDYVVLQYQTGFAARTATETVTPMREADGSWKVAGYFIK